MNNLAPPVTQTDTLIKPDMRAVLARTHLSVDLRGFLLPIFEALSNSFDGIDQRFREESVESGKILINFTGLGEKQNFSISISDNGIGLDDENYKSFRTPFSGYKLNKRGRGFGRFIAFKVFDRILYSSRYANGAGNSIRAFRFDIEREDEIVFF